MNMKRISVLLWMFASLLLTSCSAPVEFGRPFALGEIDKVTPGLSSQEVEGFWGKPMAVGRNKDGQLTWTWYYLRADLPARPGKEAVIQRLTVSFDQGRVVSSEYDMSEGVE